MTQKRLVLFFCLIVLAISYLLSPSHIFASSTYYVSTSGSDSNPGTQSQPWTTIQKAADMVNAGDTVYLRGGTYLNEISSWSNNGTQNNPITISSYPNEKAILDGQGTFPSGMGSYMVAIRGNWYVVKDLEITNSGGGGIFSGGTNVTIQNLDVHHSQSSAIILSGDYNLAQNNRAWSNSLVNENYKSGVAGGWGSGISCARYPHHCTIKGNTVYDTWGEGISTFEATHTTIEDNVSYNNQQNFYLSDTLYSIFQRNISYCTPGNVIDPYETQCGILVGDEKGVPMVNGVIDPTGKGTRYPSSDNKILNNFVTGCDRNLAAGAFNNNLYAYNTFVNSAGDANERANVLIYVAGTCTNCRFVNNLTLQDNNLPITLGGGVNTGWTFSNNLWSRTPGFNFSGTNDVISNPNLAKTGLTGPGQLTADYFKILAGSSAINKAIVLPEISTDHFLSSRGSNPDIGGHEYNSTSNPASTPTVTPAPSATIPPAITNTPVPTSPSLSCQDKAKRGDYNCNNAVDDNDFRDWSRDMRNRTTSILYFEYWRRAKFR